MFGKKFLLKHLFNVRRNRNEVGVFVFQALCVYQQVGHLEFVGGERFAFRGITDSSSCPLLS